jgi:hypothetical protein
MWRSHSTDGSGYFYNYQWRRQSRGSRAPTSSINTTIKTDALQYAMAVSSPSLIELASKISAAASVIDDYLTKNNIPKPSFDVNGPTALPNDPKIQIAKMQMQEALMDMKDLLLGPNSLLSSELVPVWPFRLP